MDFVPYLLVLISALTHAYWNFLLKRSDGGNLFIGLSKIAEVIFFFTPFIYFITKDDIQILNYWVFYTVGALLVIFNYIFLGQAYKRGDLSLIYPIARAGTLFFLPAIAYVFIGESIDNIGLAAILLIVSGLFVIQLDAFKISEVKLLFAKLKNSGIIFAFLAAFTAACYTVWDKHSVSFLPPFVYFYAYTALVGLSYAVFIFTKYPVNSIRAELTTHINPILQVGLFNTLTYLLVLYSLQTGKASYVIALRQLSIVFGALMGWKLLKEKFPLPQKIGVAVLVGGCLLISLAR